MFKIGDFSKICRVPVSALRYYADIGLLEPAYIDRFTGYRYYSLDQFPRLNRILALKDLGLSLEQIGRLLDDAVSPAEIRGMLKLKQAEIQQVVEAEQARLERVEARLRQIEQEGKMPEHDVVLKTIEPQYVFSVREVIPAPEHIGMLIGGSYGAMVSNGINPVGPPLVIYYDEEFNPERLDVEVAFPVAPSVKTGIALESGQQLQVRELPTIKLAACIIHKGPYENFGETYGALGKWIETNGYRLAGPPREIYLSPPDTGTEPVTEIQFPVEKA